MVKLKGERDEEIGESFWKEELKKGVYMKKKKKMLI